MDFFFLYALYFLVGPHHSLWPVRSMTACEEMPFFHEPLERPGHLKDNVGTAGTETKLDVSAKEVLSPI